MLPPLHHWENAKNLILSSLLTVAVATGGGKYLDFF